MDAAARREREYFLFDSVSPRFRVSFSLSCLIVIIQQNGRWCVAGRLPDGTIRWTAPSGRTYTTEPTRYPI
jgi:hypothetical protein